MRLRMDAVSPGSSADTLAEEDTQHEGGDKVIQSSWSYAKGEEKETQSYTQGDSEKMTQTYYAMPSSPVRTNSTSNSKKYWGLVVLFGSFMCRVLQDGFLFALGVFVVKWQEHFEAGAAAVGLVSSITTALMLMMCPLGSAMSRYYGCRNTVICGGVAATVGLITASRAVYLWNLYVSMAIVGVGMGIILVPSMVIIQYYYDDKLARVNGIAMSGVGVGVFTLSPLLHYLCECFGWKGAVLIAAAIVSHLCLCGAVFRPSESELKCQSSRRESPKSVEAREDQSRQSTIYYALYDLLQWDLIFHNIAFFRFLVVSLLFGFGYYSAFVYVCAHAMDIAMTPREASFLLAIAGLCSILGRLTHGFLIDLKILSAANLYTIAMGFCGCCCLFYPLAKTFVLLHITTAIFGISSGVMNALVAIVPKEIVGTSRVSEAVGLILFMEGVGTLIGVYVMGVLFDATGNYTLSFWSAGSAMVLGVILMLAEPFIRTVLTTCKPKPRRQDPEQWL